MSTEKRKVAVFTIVVQVPEDESYEYTTIYGLELKDGYIGDFVAYQVLEYEVPAP